MGAGGLGEIKYSATELVTGSTLGGCGLIIPWTTIGGQKSSRSNAKRVNSLRKRLGCFFGVRIPFEGMIVGTPELDLISVMLVNTCSLAY